ncbi:MAG: phosphotransferase [Myxococcales bacterium]|nr:phosphotransferase [Myxococcales bacterium]
MDRPAATAAQPDTRLRGAVRDALGTDVTRIEAIPGQLGLRRFLRVFLASGRPATLIARIDAPEDPSGRPGGAKPEPPLEPIRAFLEHHGLPVPRRYGGVAGLDLLEDLGSQSLADAAAAAPDERRALYAQACDLVPRLQALRDPGGGIAAFERRLDAGLFAYKADVFARWSLPERGHSPSAAELRAVREAFAFIAGVCERAPERLAHRDLQSTNLLVVGAATRRIAMIDLQGAFLAPPEYDLVCLLRDSYVELPEAEVRGQLDRVRPRLPDAPDADSFARRFDLLTLTRKGKDHARFVMAARERGDPRFLRFVPATVRALRAAAGRAAAAEPQLARLAELVHALPETACAR